MPSIIDPAYESGLVDTTTPSIRLASGAVKTSSVGMLAMKRLPNTLSEPAPSSGDLR